MELPTGPFLGKPFLCGPSFLQTIVFVSENFKTFLSVKNNRYTLQVGCRVESTNPRAMHSTGCSAGMCFDSAGFLAMPGDPWCQEWCSVFFIMEMCTYSCLSCLLNFLIFVGLASSSLLYFVATFFPSSYARPVCCKAPLNSFFLDKCSELCRRFCC